MQRRPLVVGNWKMNGSRADALALVADLREQIDPGAAEIALCPPFVYLSELNRALQDSGIALGAQTVSGESEGAFTGEVSASMLVDCGCCYVIVGHSERRGLYGETDEQVAAKLSQARSRGLTPILCVGESLQQREAEQTLEFIEEQLRRVIEAVGVDSMSGAVIAYEPIWAIGTGRTATPAQAQQVHAHIRRVLDGYSGELAQETRLLYGGSVKADNAASLFAEDDIDGALVGGASLNANEFASIYRAAS